MRHLAMLPFLALACGPVEVVVLPLAGGGGPGDCSSQISYIDADGDGFGDSTTAQVGCPEGGRIADGGDCDDQDPTIRPGAEERCNLIDDDCDPQTTELGLTYVDGVRVDDLNAALQGAGRTTEVQICGGEHDLAPLDVPDSVDTLTILGIHPSLATAVASTGEPFAPGFQGNLVLQDLTLRDLYFYDQGGTDIHIEDARLVGPLFADQTSAGEITLFHIDAEPGVQVQLAGPRVVTLGDVNLGGAEYVIVLAVDRIQGSGLTVVSEAGAVPMLQLGAGDRSGLGAIELVDLKTRGADVTIQGRGQVSNSLVVDGEITLRPGDGFRFTGTSFIGETGMELDLRPFESRRDTRVVDLTVQGNTEATLAGGEGNLTLSALTVDGLDGRIHIRDEVAIQRSTLRDNIAPEGLVNVRPGAVLTVSDSVVTGNRVASGGAFNLLEDTWLQLISVDVGRGDQRNTRVDVSGVNDLWWDGEGVVNAICSGDGACFSR